MKTLIDSSGDRFALGVEEMDETHIEFIELVNRLGNAGKQEFIDLFKQLIEHTEAHFAAENERMEETGFPAIQEHRGEHLRVLGEMNRIGKRVAAGSLMLGRAYVEEQLPSWFSLHAATMDSALAAHIKARFVTLSI
ncbi:MAG: hemerythrin domain-containing protein [Candidatus Sedimenticola endophacoides]